MATVTAVSTDNYASQSGVNLHDCQLSYFQAHCTANGTYYAQNMQYISIGY